MAETYVLEDCQLEWDRERGVLYVHNKETGATVLRVQGLPVARGNVELLPGKVIDLRTDEASASVPLV